MRKFIFVSLIICCILVIGKIYWTQNQPIKSIVMKDESMQTQNKNIISILDSIEKEDFLTPTFIASGHNTVIDILHQTPEFTFLLDNVDSSLPPMRSRYRNQKTTMPDNVRLVYFIVFGLTRDKEMMDDIISYLKQSKGSPENKLLSPWHPFLYGIQALSEITNGQIQPLTSNNAKKDIDKFLIKIDNWDSDK